MLDYPSKLIAEGQSCSFETNHELLQEEWQRLEEIVLKSELEKRKAQEEND